MKYISTRNKEEKVSYANAVKKGLAKDGGLFLPERIPTFSKQFYNDMKQQALSEIAFKIAKSYIEEEIPDSDLRYICEDALSFDIPLKQIYDNIYALELFHGPTAAFKDVGARFMARCLGYFSQQSKKKTLILAATSGDTGSAVADGFDNVEGVEVIILYPKGKVSQIQEKQLCYKRMNVKTLEINGTFDDCQSLVKKAFHEFDTKDKINLTSANSINIARLIPQSFYYYYACSQLNTNNVYFSVPSGNFGNLSGGILAKMSGLSVQKFVASTNVNDIVPVYLKNGDFDPKPSIQTISNAMDVGNPSNFERLEYLFETDYKKMGELISGYSFSDSETKQQILKYFRNYNYQMCPHTAIASLGLEKELENKDAMGVFLCTAHPAKFPEVVKEVTDSKPKTPVSLQKFVNTRKHAVPLQNSYNDLCDFIENNYF